MVGTTSESLSFLYHHVFLPPKLPQSGDAGCSNECELFGIMQEAIEMFEPLVSGDDKLAVRQMKEMVKNSRCLHDETTRTILESEAKRLIQSLPDRGGFLMLHVSAQNAGVIIHAIEEDKSLSFELFELSARNEAVMSTKGRLLRSFPGCATSITPDISADSDFAASVAHTLALMSHQAVAGQQPKAFKALFHHDEDRDTTHPGMVTELFSGLLAGIGQCRQVTSLSKACRDDVLWHNARQPWRRSPTWMLLRVSLQLGLLRLGVRYSLSRNLYKQIMVLFTARILSKSVKSGLPSDTLHTMISKLTRRLRKLTDPNSNVPVNQELVSIVSRITRTAQETLSQRWLKIQQQEGSPPNLDQLSSLSFEDDTRISLPEVDRFIEDIDGRKSPPQHNEYTPKDDFVVYDQDNLPDLAIGSQSVNRKLHAFEVWVADSLQNWTASHIDDSDTCCQLLSKIRDYHSKAKAQYTKNPEATSLMRLTLLELWMACDRAAVSNCPMLGDYVPALHREPLQNLLLPFRQQTDRLDTIEGYICKRSQARFNFSQMSYAMRDPQSFALRYFDSSAEHQTIKSTIEQSARVLRAAKEKELEDKQQEYAEWERLFDSTTCEYEEIEWVNRYGQLRQKTRHVRGCSHCHYLSKMKSMSIEVHEWPLPSDLDIAKTVVFELCVPEWFNCWRDATMYLRMDVLGSQYTDPVKATRARKMLIADPHLRNRFIGRQYMTTLLSETKPHVGSHRRYKEIATATNDDVCVANGLSYQYFDVSRDVFIGEISSTQTVAKDCAYVFPTGCEALQPFIFRPAGQPNGPIPNRIISEQSRCPEHLVLPEFKELASIPLGFSLQWWNMMVQLGAPSVDFRKSETAFLFMQCMYQAGPFSHSQRVSHLLPRRSDFASQIVQHLDKVFERIAQNWELLDCLATLVNVATRLFNLNDSKTIRHDCLQFLKRARGLSMRWCSLLKAKSATASSIDRSTLSSRCTEAALICASTYHVPRTDLKAVLNDSDSVVTLIHCAISIHEGTGIVDSGLRFHLTLQRHLRVLQDAVPILSGGKNLAAIEMAVSKAWSGYQRSGQWKVSSTSQHWMVTTSAESSGAGNSVHLNLLTGELLVNGLPHSLLPKEYSSHPLYKLLFQTSSIEAMSSAVPGMEFSGRYLHQGYQLDFGMNGEDLRVRSVDRETQVSWELIPSRVLRGSIPDSFVTDFVHWYNVQSGHVDFRPVERPWSRETSQHLVLTKNVGSLWQLSRPVNGESVVGVQSRTAQALAKILSPLSPALRIHTTFQVSSAAVHVNIPHLRLGFWLKHGSSALSSNEFAGYVLDSDQCLNTLVGLRNRIMLRHTTTKERMVLILQGQVSHTESHSGEATSHTQVSIDLVTATKALPFRVDTQLGRLVDNGHLQSKLHLAYLHALTSYCLPDPLIELTGSEQALSILRSSAVRSFDNLTAENAETLRSIAALAPRRSYYPPERREMQTINWNRGLSFHSQRFEYHQLVESLFHQQKRWNSMYHLQRSQLAPLRSYDTHLETFGQIRNSFVQPSEFGAENFELKDDVTYQARDVGQDSQRYRGSYKLASKIVRSCPDLSLPRVTQDKLWKFLTRARPVLHPLTDLNSFPIEYSGSHVHCDGKDLARQFLSLICSLLSDSDRPCRFRLASWLSTMACSPELDFAILEAVASFYVCPEMFSIMQSDNLESFSLSDGRHLKNDDVLVLVRRHVKAFSESAEIGLVIQTGESNESFTARQQHRYHYLESIAVKELTDALYLQWPTMYPATPKCSSSVPAFIDLDGAMASIRPVFESRKHNADLYDYLKGLSENLAQLSVVTVSVPLPSHSKFEAHFDFRPFVEACSLFDGPAPKLPLVRICPAASMATQPIRRDYKQIEQLVASLRQKAEQSGFEKRYYEDLQESVTSLTTVTSHQSESLPSIEGLRWQLKKCERQLNKANRSLGESATHEDDGPTAVLCRLTHTWPRVRPCFFLSQLHRRNWSRLSQPWRDCIVRYAIAHTVVQQLKRLIKAAASGDQGDLSAEFQNAPHAEWDPNEYPEWLLLEVESNIAIRTVQADIAKEMITPQDNRNASMQLNMGEGKSSVIVPIAVSSLTDGANLVRVIVAKPQSKQMAQMMVTKLGGMLDRQVYYMPFSRNLKVDTAGAKEIRDMCQECMENGGLLLVQPEHILSFQLMGIEAYISDKNQLGGALLKAQRLFDDSARDIIDESDENFSVKYELVYTVGTQCPIEFSPSRWTYTQEILDIVRSVAIELGKERPWALEIHESAAHAFPRIRVLDQATEGILINALVSRVCEVGLTGLAISRQPKETRLAIQGYIGTISHASDRDLPDAIRTKFKSEGQKNALLLVRGLLAGGIITFVLSRKRWRVNYGLDASRDPKTQLAVPYRAKDMPTARSEFSHPEIVILLTCLSYYYGGLDDDKIRSTFEHLLETDQREIEYQEWIKGVPNLDPAFRNIDGVNLKDQASCGSLIFPALRYSKAMIDYFLKHFVFPKEIKEFPHKLSASGWDLGRAKQNPTSAFSGTSDSQVLLPIDVKHLSLPTQQHTNALVMAYLLQPENSVIMQSSVGESAALALIQLVIGQTVSPRVILDVGAQILELSNVGVAREWLQRTDDDETKAAVYVDDNDVVSVIDRTGFNEPLQTSPFADQLGSCLVFLDEAHTRGIDLKLPRHYRAAVTLGANLTKDRLVQACMRMRKLGHGQSVLFCVTQEIHGKIMQCTGKSPMQTVTVSDVLQWSMWETCADIGRNLPLWAAQGRRFVRQEKLWKLKFSKETASKFLEEEAQSLRKRYGTIQSSEDTSKSKSDPRLAKIEKRYQKYGVNKLLENTLQEEQERELSPEIEQERQIEKAQPASPVNNSLHEDVVRFAKDGTINSSSIAYFPAFQIFSNIPAAKKFDVSQLFAEKALWATKDFATTVAMWTTADSSSFQRPVQWILTTNKRSSKEVRQAMIISPFEAQKLFPSLYASRPAQAATLHRYKPHWNLEHHPSDRFDGFTVPPRSNPMTMPPSLAAQIHLFAGRLYFGRPQDHADLCKYLGLAHGRTDHETTADGFILDPAARVGAWPGLKQNPLSFVEAVLRIRRDGVDFSKTHMGRLIAGDMNLARIVERDLAERGVKVETGSQLLRCSSL